jgi:hypothetical protein
MSLLHAYSSVSYSFLQLARYQCRAGSAVQNFLCHKSGVAICKRQPLSFKRNLHDMSSTHDMHYLGTAPGSPKCVTHVREMNMS